ncbi:Fucose permease [Parapedobacter luteus]|uniref:Fucose permease n=1 Tax=Parapedobacter luteus TaxID=623280 RepID=A0A1T5DCA3_9SPHI|nr:MFS transporter [Parapedobacter luteus]SKB69140.1 Fucose permease [Parapedobacter luteus]
MNLKSGLLLLVIYLAFISLGLPDSLLGPAWPTMYVDLRVPVHFAGIISMIIAGGTVVSSLLSARLISRYGVAAITTSSVLITALALLGFSVSQHFVYLCLLAVPLGLGAGCVDAALNNYVALHYRARHMNWLHSFWGVGAATGPMIMAAQLSAGAGWASGYRTVGWIQIALFLVLLASLPLWIPNATEGDGPNRGRRRSFYELLKIRGVKQALIIFFCYCTVEATFGLWGASFLVFARDVEPEDAARLVSVYFVGITAGRFISGFVSERVGNKQLVYIGEGLIAAGLLVLLLPVKTLFLPGFLLVGLGCAPIFPSLLHETPRNFGEQHSQAIMGLQMASAYIGITVMPLLFGKLASHTGYAVLPAFMGVVLAVKIVMTWHLNRKVT